MTDSHSAWDTDQTNTGKDTDKKIASPQHWICYRCNLTFDTNSIAELHSILSDHHTTAATRGSP